MVVPKMNAGCLNEDTGAQGPGRYFPGAEANGLREHLRGADERYSSRLEYD